MHQPRVTKKAGEIDGDLGKCADDITGINTSGILNGFKREHLGKIAAR